MSNFTMTVSGQLSGFQDRNIEENMTVNFSKLFAPFPGEKETDRFDPKKSIPRIVPIWDVTHIPDQLPVADCFRNDGVGIQGDLGIADTVLLGLGAFREQDAVVSPGYPSISVTNGVAGLPTITSNVFGSTIDFSITAGLSVGPQWSLTHLKGPSGSGGSVPGSGGSGLLTGSRVVKDTLIISFAPSCLEPGGPRLSDKAPDWEKSLAKNICGATAPKSVQHAQALSAAATNNTRLLLQNLQLTNPLLTVP